MHFSHIQEDMKQFSFGEKELANMSDEEKNFYFFKLHDSDNNDHLDGLEILHAATHHSDGHVHKLDPNTGEDESDDNSVIGKMVRAFPCRLQKRVRDHLDNGNYFELFGTTFLRLRV